MSQVSLSDLKFRKSAASDLTKAARSNHAASFQKKLLKQWSDAKSPLFSHLPDIRFSSTIGIWAVLTKNDADLFDSAAEVGAATTKASIKKTLESVIQSVSADAANGRITSDFSMLLAMELVAEFGAKFSPEQFQDTILAIANFDCEAGADHISSSSVSDILSEDASCESEDAGIEGSQLRMIRTIIRFAEIPFRRSVLLDALSKSSAERKAALETVAQAIEASTDTDGTVHSRLAQDPANWLAPLIRISSVAASTGHEWAKPKTIKRWVAALEFFAALSIHQGWLNDIQVDDVIAPSEDNEYDLAARAIVAGRNLQPVHLLNSAMTALQTTGKPSGKKAKKAKPDLLKESSIPDVVAAMLKSKGKAKKKPGPELDWYSPSTQSDWAAMALLRTGYEVDADSALVDWDQDKIRLALSALGCAVAGGEWGADILVNGKEVVPVGDWTCTCWFQDDDVAFAEMERGSVDETRHVRHIMLHLRDHFALLTDSVLAKNEDDQVVLRTSLPIAAGVHGSAATVTRELFLETAGPKCRVIPAWLPDDRVDSTDGDCRIENGTLKSAAVGNGGTFMPLVLDWAPKNAKREADWTQLTITEEGETLTSYQAAAARTRIGRQQLMLYRSMRPGETLRAVLGHHTANETVYGKFTNDGDIDPLVMVEPTA